MLLARVGACKNRMDKLDGLREGPRFETMLSPQHHVAECSARKSTLHDRVRFCLFCRPRPCNATPISFSVTPVSLLVLIVTRFPARVALLHASAVIRVKQAVHDGICPKSLVLRRYAQSDRQVNDLQEYVRHHRRPHNDADDSQQLDAKKGRTSGLRKRRKAKCETDLHSM